MQMCFCDMLGRERAFHLLVEFRKFRAIGLQLPQVLGAVKSMAHISLSRKKSYTEKLEPCDPVESKDVWAGK